MTNKTDLEQEEATVISLKILREEIKKALGLEEFWGSVERGIRAYSKDRGGGNYSRKIILG